MCEFDDFYDRRLARRINFLPPKRIICDKIHGTLSTPEETKVRNAIVEPMKYPFLFEISKRCFLLHGEDGCGKSVLARNIFKIFKHCVENTIHLFLDCKSIIVKHAINYWKLLFVYISTLQTNHTVVLECENIHLFAQQWTVDLFNENPHLVVVGTTASLHLEECKANFTNMYSMIVEVTKPNSALMADIINTSLLRVIDQENAATGLNSRDSEILQKLETWCREIAVKMDKKVTICELCNILIPQWISCLSKARRNWYDQTNKCIPSSFVKDQKEDYLARLQTTGDLSIQEINQLNASQDNVIIDSATAICSSSVTSQLKLNIKWLTEAWSLVAEIGERVFLRV